jgi:hypothetical protein
VLDGVSESLAADEICGGFDPRAEAVDWGVHLDGEWCATGKLTERGPKACVEL